MCRRKYKELRQCSPAKSILYTEQTVVDFSSILPCALDNQTVDGYIISVSSTCGKLPGRSNLGVGKIYFEKIKMYHGGE